MHVSQPAARWRAIPTLSARPQVGTSVRAMSFMRTDLVPLPSSGRPNAPQSAFPAEYSYTSVNPRLSSRHAARGLMSHWKSWQYTTRGRSFRSADAVLASSSFSGMLIAPGRCSSAYSSRGRTSTTCAPSRMRRCTSSRSTTLCIRPLPSDRPPPGACGRACAPSASRQRGARAGSRGRTRGNRRHPAAASARRGCASRARPVPHNTSRSLERPRMQRKAVASRAVSHVAFELSAQPLDDPIHEGEERDMRRDVGTVRLHGIVATSHLAAQASSARSVRDRADGSERRSVNRCSRVGSGGALAGTLLGPASRSREGSLPTGREPERPEGEREAEREMVQDEHGGSRLRPHRLHADRRKHEPAHHHSNDITPRDAQTETGPTDRARQPQEDPEEQPPERRPQEVHDESDHRRKLLDTHRTPAP